MFGYCRSQLATTNKRPTGGSLAEIDGLQFARAGLEISGQLSVDQLPRLAELGCRTAGLEFRLAGTKNSRGKLALRVHFSGVGEMSCQRCLGPVELDLSGDEELELAGSLQEIETAHDDVDRVLASSSMDVAELVEDEAILLLPMVPRHDRCAGAGLLPATEDTATVEVKKVSPFSVLASLKKGGKR